MFSRLSTKITLGAGLILLSAVAVIPMARLFGEGNPSIAYLKGKTLSPWSIMALSVAGETPALDSLKTVSSGKAIDLEAPILALTASGQNPRTFGATDLVEKLKGLYDGTQLGDATLLNDDIFGLLALLGAKEPVDGAIPVGVKNFILSHKAPDGGFPFAVGGTSDTNTTAAAIMALRSAGIPASNDVLKGAVLYLKSAQNNDGGFPYDPKSNWGTDSDASSDAWVIMALTSLGEQVSLWQKNGKTPVTHLESLKQDGGFYLYQAGGAEDAFTPVTTAYALLALSGKTLPVTSTDASLPAEATFNVQVEGRTALLCDTDGTGKTALDALKVAAKTCNLSYHLQSSGLGDYIDEVADERASGSSGWLYTVNRVLPSVGAGAYTLKTGDAVRWYYGNFDGTADSDAFRTEIPLSVTIPTPSPAGGGTPQGNGTNEKPEAESTVSMMIELGKAGGKNRETLGFGTAKKGEVVEKTVTLRNSGGVATTLSGSVSGSAVFRRYLKLNGKTWRSYRVTLSANMSTTTGLSLSVPSDYADTGTKTGALIFWATPAAQ